MSGFTSAPRGFAPAARDGVSVGDRARALWAKLVLMRRAAVTRRDLGTLDRRLLSDIGVDRAEAALEAERWPWDLAPSRAPGRGAESAFR